MSKQPKETIPTDLRTFRQAAMHNRQLAEQMLTQCPGLLREQDGVGETALHYCAIEGSREAVVWLISKGASVNTCTNSKSTPLIHAALFGQFEICKILVNAGADLMATEAIESDTALHAAARHGHLEVCRLLLEAGAMVNATNDEGQHPWDIALPRKREQVRELLKNYGGSASNQHESA